MRKKIRVSTFWKLWNKIKTDQKIRSRLKFNAILDYVDQNHEQLAKEDPVTAFRFSMCLAAIYPEDYAEFCRVLTQNGYGQVVELFDDYLRNEFTEKLKNSVGDWVGFRRHFPEHWLFFENREKQK